MRIVIGSSINVNLILVTHGRIVNTIAGMDYWDMKELGAIVKRERLRRGMRGIDLAYAIGKDPGYVTRMEHGTLKEIPDPAVIHALGQALGVSDARLLRAIGYPAVESTEPAEPAPDDPLAALVATFTPRQREMLLSLLDQANARALEDEAARRTPKRQQETP
jgi:transcriptional regulator with XRE-family HTH domain